MVRPGSGRFEVGFWVGFRVGLRARDFPTEGELSRTPLIIRTLDQKKKDGASCVFFLYSARTGTGDCPVAPPSGSGLWLRMRIVGGQTDPNQAEPYKDSEPPLARRPYVARVTHGPNKSEHKR